MIVAAIYTLIGEDGRPDLIFADEATAIAAGYRPCANCMREEYRAWKSAQG